MTELLAGILIAAVVTFSIAIWHSAWAPHRVIPEVHPHPFKPRPVTIIRPDGLFDVCADCGGLRVMARRMQATIHTGRPSTIPTEWS